MTSQQAYLGMVGDMAVAMPLFDSWLQTSLQRLYDKTLEAPLPDGLLRILQEGSSLEHPQ